MFPDQGFGRPQLAVAQAVILRQFNRRLNPVFGFTIGAVHVYMQPRFLA